MVNAALLLICVATSALAVVHRPSKTAQALVQHRVKTLQSERLVNVGMMFVNKNDCWRHIPVAMTQLAAQVYKVNQSNPGAGLNVKDQKGYGTVMKDGFYEVACVKDYMYNHGDAAGANKHEYEIGSRSNVSIVHYSMMVPKEDREAMSHEVCFNFCRTVPDMLFFGLTAGRECYCEPYFKPMAGDSSACDAVCEGTPTTMCGGMAKSSVFQMHFCNTMGEDLAAAAEKAESFLKDATPIGEAAMGDAEALQSAAQAGQDAFGKAGDTVMSDLMQSAKVFAGEFQHKVEDATKIGSKLDEEVSEANGKFDFTDPASMKKAEDTMKNMEETLAKLEAAKEEGMDLHELARGTEYSKDGELKEAEGEPLKQYKPTMYFVDKEFDSVPSTCGGETLKKPMLASDAQDCAAACDSEGNACAGFSYVNVADAKDKVCFLFSKFKSVTYYTECKSEKSFLQKDGEDAKTMCYAKFASFTGTTLKPDPSGKCDLCLKTADKAQRCFE